MNITEVLEKVKTSCRIDGEEVNDEIVDFIESAEIYLKNAGININYENNLYFLAVKMLVKHWYDADGITGKVNEIPYGLNSIINQLQICGVGEISEAK